MPTVLIIDRDADILLAAFALLHDAGYGVATAGTPLGAVAAADMMQPDLVFLGARIAVWANSLIVDHPPPGVSRPCIVLTGDGARFNWQPLGADGFLDRPVTAERMLAVAERLQQLAAARRDRQERSA